MTMTNPVLPQVLNVLRQHPEGITEYRLLRHLENENLFDESADADGILGLYRKHFLIMNALYDLQEVLWEEEHRVLDISPLHIELHERQPVDADEVEEPAWYPLLSEYYLDWTFYRDTTERDIQQMMDDLKAAH